MIVPSLLLSWAVSATGYRANWRTPKYLDATTVLIMLTFVVLLSAGAFVGSTVGISNALPRKFGEVSRPTRALLQRLFWIAFGLAIFGYAAWAASSLRNGLRPSDIIDTLRSNSNYTGELKRLARTIPGVTTLTQVAIAAIVVGTFLNVAQTDRRRRAAMIVLFSLAAARAYLLTERLALVELVVPVIVIRSVVWRTSTHQRARTLAQMAPLLAVVGLFTVFATFEASRSWTHFSKTSSDGFVVFAAERLVGYYATSYNNSALFDREGLRPDVPYHTTQFFWAAPGVSAVLSTPTPQTPRGEDPNTVLRRYGSLEFNTSSGLDAPRFDYGLVGGAIYMLVMGVGVGVVYRGFAKGSLGGSFAYPIVFCGLLDLPRELYLTSSRVLPSFLFIAGAVLWIKHREAATASGRLVPSVRPGALVEAGR